MNSVLERCRRIQIVTNGRENREVQKEENEIECKVNYKSV
jgi:hypothetical protein